MKFKEVDVEMEYSDSNEESSILAKRVRKNRDQIKALNRAYEMAQGSWTKED